MNVDLSDTRPHASALRLKARVSMALGVLALLALAPLQSAHASDVGDDGDAAGVLHLGQGQYLAGSLGDSEAGSIAWRHPAFAEPFHFPSSVVQEVSFPSPRIADEDPLGFELVNGDQFFASVESIADGQLHLHSSRLGSISVPVTSLRRIFQWQGGQANIFTGPGPLADWTATLGERDPAQAWRDQGGQLSSDSPGATLRRSIGLVAQSRVEIEISWPLVPRTESSTSGVIRQQVVMADGAVVRRVIRPNAQPVSTSFAPPNFVLALAVGEEVDSAKSAYRLEVWDDTLVLLRELEKTADVVPLGNVQTMEGRLRISIEIDQQADTAVAYSEQGVELGRVTLDDNQDAVLPGIQLENIRGTIQLDSLRVMRSGTARAADDRANVVRWHLSDGTTLYGEPTGMADGKFLIRDGDQDEQQVDPSQLLAVQFPVPASEQSDGTGGSNEDSETAENYGSGSGEASADNGNGAQDEEDSAGETLGGDELEMLDQKEDEAPVSDGVVRITLHSGVRLSGRLIGIRDGQITLHAPSIQTDVSLPVDQLRFLRSPSSAAPPKSRGREGVLRTEDTEVRGVLEGRPASADASCIAFRPRGANAAARLALGASGEIVYREPPPETAEVVQTRVVMQQPRGFIGALADAFAGAPAHATPGRNIHLRSGDIVSGKVVQITDQGLLLDSPIVGERWIPHDELRAAELSVGTPLLEEARRQRLLTVPRMRKKSPPTHLLVSVDGDYLRGNLVSMDQETVRVETRLETIEIPRRVVGTIIWMHEDEIEPAPGDTAASTKANADADADTGGESPEATVDPAALAEGADEPAADESAADAPDPLPPGAIQVHTQQQNGVRLSFAATEMGGGELVGTSPLLGSCIVDIASVDAIAFGAHVETKKAEGLYREWRLSHAPLPTVMTESAEGESGRTPGTASQLVGTEAPEFKLAMLDGTTFSLGEHRGKVVVLDFWATWCGPCMQAMPQIHDAVAAFPDEDVLLVAVNLQESADQIRPTLERLGIEPAVALDIDGVAAARYQANAIPQTVVIDREGRIHRLFIGGGNKLKEQLHAAIDELVNGA